MGIGGNCWEWVGMVEKGREVWGKWWEWWMEFLRHPRRFSADIPFLEILLLFVFDNRLALLKVMFLD